MLNFICRSLKTARHIQDSRVRTKQERGIPQREVDMLDVRYNFVECSLDDCDKMLWRSSFSKFNGATSGTVTEVVPRGQAYRLTVVVENTILFLLDVLYLPLLCKYENSDIENFFSISNSMPKFHGVGKVNDIK
jgi:hypothetical protein